MSLFLKGLVARHPGAALATFGFYCFFEKPVKISWEPYLGTYSPVIHTDEVQDINELVKLLTDKKRWEKLLWKKDPCAKGSKDILLSTYIDIIKNDKSWSVLGTDFILDKCTNEKKEHYEDIIVGQTPFAMYVRNINWHRIVNEWINCLNDEQVKKILTDIWGLDCYSNGQQRNGLFYEINPQESRSGIKRTVPVICLLACLACKLFPCFKGREGKATALGWFGDNFYYPIFSKPVDKFSFISWVANIKLLLKMPFESKKSIGLSAVYETSRRGYKGTITEYVLWQGKEVK
jgi:hypothetical protein